MKRSDLDRLPARARVEAPRQLGQPDHTALSIETAGKVLALAFPNATKCARRSEPTSHDRLVRTCLVFLDARRIFAWHNNTGALKVDNRFVRFGKVGSPDIIAVVRGQFWGIECKCGQDKLTSGQVEFSRRLLDAGGRFLLVWDTIDRLVEELDGINTGATDGAAHAQ